MTRYLFAAIVAAALALPNLAYAQHHHGGGGGGWHGGGGGWHHGGGGWHGGYGYGFGAVPYAYPYGEVAPVYVEPVQPRACWYPQYGAYYACGY